MRKTMIQISLPQLSIPYVLLVGAYQLQWLNMQSLQYDELVQ